MMLDGFPQGVVVFLNGKYTYNLGRDHCEQPDRLYTLAYEKGYATVLAIHNDRWAADNSLKKG